MTPTRRLADIMAADVAGFSAATERDEEGTFAQLRELRPNIFEREAIAGGQDGDPGIERSQRISLLRAKGLE